MDKPPKRRRSSILKQNNISICSDTEVVDPIKTQKRRVSFGTSIVKPFTETDWENSYEECLRSSRNEEDNIIMSFVAEKSIRVLKQTSMEITCQKNSSDLGMEILSNTNNSLYYQTMDATNMPADSLMHHYNNIAIDKENVPILVDENDSMNSVYERSLICQADMASAPTHIPDSSFQCNLTPVVDDSKFATVSSKVFDRSIRTGSLPVDSFNEEYIDIHGTTTEKLLEGERSYFVEQLRKSVLDEEKLHYLQNLTENTDENLSHVYDDYCLALKHNYFAEHPNHSSIINQAITEIQVFKPVSHSLDMYSEPPHINCSDIDKKISDNIWKIRDAMSSIKWKPLRVCPKELSESHGTPDFTLEAQVNTATFATSFCENINAITTFKTRIESKAKTAAGAWKLMGTPWRTDSSNSECRIVDLIVFRDWFIFECFIDDNNGQVLQYTLKRNETRWSLKGSNEQRYCATLFEHHFRDYDKVKVSLGVSFDLESFLDYIELKLQETKKLSIFLRHLRLNYNMSIDDNLKITLNLFNVLLIIDSVITIQANADNITSDSVQVTNHIGDIDKSWFTDILSYCTMGFNFLPQLIQKLEETLKTQEMSLSKQHNGI